MSGERNCRNCQYWMRITKEGSPGGPQVEARPGWGKCMCNDLVHIRKNVMGVETGEKHLCIAYRPKE